MDYSPSLARLIEDYPHLEHFGAIPTAQEHGVLSTAKKTFEHKRTCLNLEADALRERLEQVQTELVEVQQQIDAHACIVSPLRRVPAEILHHIFAASAPSTTLGLQDMTLVAPWTLLRVCRHWRDVCLTYGSLWASINISMGTTSLVQELPVSFAAQIIYQGYLVATGARVVSAPNHVQRACELLELQLRRSQEADLSVVIEATLPAGCDFAQPFLRILLPHIHRCVRIDAPYHILAHTPLPRTLDRLTHLSLNYSTALPSVLFPEPSSEEQLHAEQTQLMLNLSQQPNLRHVCALKSISSIESTIAPMWPSPKLLTRIVLKIASLDERALFAGGLCLQLAECSSLSEVSLTEGLNGVLARQHISEASQYPPQTLLPRVWMLHLHTRKSKTTLLRRLKLPRLTHLLAEFQERVDSEPIAEMLETSSAQLRCLRIHGARKFFKDELDKLFVAKPQLWASLQTLEMASDPAGGATNPYRANASKHPVVNANIIRLLTRKRAGEDASHFSDTFPRLIFLDLRLIAPSISQVVDMLESRSGANVDGDHVPLRGCRLAATLTEHRRLAGSHIQEQERNLVIHSILAEGENRAQDEQWWSTSLVSQSINDRSSRMLDRNKGLDVKLRNPRVWWDEGVKREPMQSERLRKLEEGGLELWTRYTWTDRE